MNKQKLIKLRCKAWGITEDEYYCNQCSDFSLDDMARAYRRGKNKGFEKVKELEAQIEKMKMCCNCRKWRECGEQLDHISYPCHQHDCDDVCPIWELWERR